MVTSVLAQLDVPAYVLWGLAAVLVLVGIFKVIRFLVVLGLLALVVGLVLKFVG